MTTRKKLIALFAFAILGTACCVVAAIEEGVVIVEIKMKFADCPVAIQNTIQQESVGAKLNEVSKVTKDDTSVYKADVTIEARDYTILVAEDGTLLAKMLDDDDEETTIEVKFSDCPAAVQKTLKRESRGAEIETVSEVTKNEKTEYVAGAKIAGKKYEIVVREDGVLISKMLDQDAEEKEKAIQEDKET